MKQGLKHRGDVSPSQLYHAKVNFDLTPKETMEILSVLRQPAPIPPLRMDRHRGQYEAVSPRSLGDGKSPGTSFIGDSSIGSKSWENKSYVSKFLKDRGKKVDKFWKEEKYESSHIGNKGENIDNLEKREEKAADQSWSECRRNVGPAFPTSISTQGQLGERCHNKSWGRGRESVQEFPPSPENLFLEAIARSGEKQCDIPSCKTLVDSRESYRTRVCKDVSMVCDNVNTSVSSEMSKCDTKIIIGKNVQSSETKCVEAKKITQKMSVFTANSEPAKPVVSQPLKQTSQTLVKSPFSAVLSSIQKENSRVLEDERSHCQEAEKIRASIGGREFVKRALTFEVQKSEERLKSESYPSVTITSKERTTNEVGSHNVAVQNGKDPDRPLRDTREGFVKSTSLLKHLMTKGHHQTQDITQGNKQIRLEDEMEWKELEEQRQLDARETQEMEVLENLEVHVDNEVEKICNEKGVPIPSASAKAEFRRSLDSATNMVFHSKTGLPLTSSPAPLRKGKRFDYDSTLNCVAAIKR